MERVRQLFDFYLKGSLHIGLAVLSLTVITEISLQIPAPPKFHGFIFFATVFGYNLLKSFDYAQQERSWRWPGPGLLILNIVVLVAAIYRFFLLRSDLQAAIVLIGLGVLLYIVLRKYGLIKIFLVSCCITAITVYLPAMSLPSLNTDVAITALQRFLLVISLLIPFEIADSQTDFLLWQTLPQRFGIRPIKILGMLLLIPFVLLEFLKGSYSMLVLVVALITALAIHFSGTQRHRYYTTFWVESIPVFWWLLLYASIRWL